MRKRLGWFVLLAGCMFAGSDMEARDRRPDFRVTNLGRALEQRGGVPVSGVVLYEPIGWGSGNRSLDEVGTNARCNQDAIGSRQNETTIAASPVDANHMLSGSNDYRNGDASGGFYRSIDGASTFSDALVTRGPAGFFEAAGDPVAVIDGSGRMYAAYIAFDRDPGVDNGLYVQTSVDNGNTWSAPSAVVEHVGGGTPDFEDKPFACADYSPGSPYLNNYYVTWTKFRATGGAPIHFARSVDGGATFSAPIQISGSTNAQFSCPAVGPNGEVYAVWNSYSTNTIKFDYSLDGGVTWHLDPTIASFDDNFPPNPCGSWRVAGYPVIACDVSNGPRRGWIYVSWVDNSNGNPDVLFIRSTDGGSTWSAPVHVEDDATNRWQWFHWMAVNPSNGEIGISWLDSREDPAGCRYRSYASISTDGGTTWLSNFPVSDAVSDPSLSTFLGDYTGATFRANGFYSCWVDLRNDTGDAYAAWFTASPPAPVDLVIFPWGNDIILRWPDSGAPTYRIYSSLDIADPQQTVEGTTSDTTFTDVGAVSGQPYRIYSVTAIDE